MVAGAWVEGTQEFCWAAEGKGKHATMGGRTVRRNTSAMEKQIPIAAIVVFSMKYFQEAYKMPTLDSTLYANLLF